MFKFFKNLGKESSKNELIIFAPCDGEIKPLAKIQDETFSEAILGDGYFISPTSFDFYAPCDGFIEMLAATKHAVTIKNEKTGISILMHIGIDSVIGKGKGIKTYVKEGDHVTCETKIATVDKTALLKFAKTLDTPVIIMNETLAGQKMAKLVEGGLVKKGTPILSVK